MTIDLFKPLIHDDAIAAAGVAMRSGWLGMGPKVEQFEKDFAAFLNVLHALAVNTCTSALHLAVKLLNAKPGAEIITTPNSFVATSQVLLWENLTPIFADIDPATGNIDPASVAALVTEKTAALLVVHFAGCPCDLDALKKFNLPIIEDCAHAAGAFYGNARVGSTGNLAAFSFGATKNLTTADGGMLICQTPAQLEHAKKLRYLGISKDTFHRLCDSPTSHWQYEVPATGLRYHMNDPTAAIGSAQLRHLDSENNRRQQIADLYNKLLANIPGITLATYDRRHRSANYLYFILAENRDALVASLLAQEITVSVHYRPCSQYAIFKARPLPNAEKFYAHELSLPMHPRLTDDQVHQVAAAIKKGW